jgi:hypothetical protein
MTDLTVKDVLLRAADEIVRRGKETGAFYGAGTLEDCPVCAEGALSLAATGHPFPGLRPANGNLHSRTVKLLAAALGGTGESAIYNWSDDPDTSAADIAAKFRQIAGIL